MKKLLALLLSVSLLLCAATAFADNGEAEFTFENRTYRVKYVRSEIVDGQLNVLVTGFGNSLPFRNGKFVIIAWAAAIVNGKEVEAESVSAGGDGTYTYLYAADQLPEKVVIYPYEDSGNAIPLWEADGSEAAGGAEAALAVDAPEFLLRSWNAPEIRYETELQAGGISVKGTMKTGTAITFNADGTMKSDFTLADKIDTMPFEPGDVVIDFTGYDHFTWDDGKVTLLPDGPTLNCEYDEGSQKMTLTMDGVVTLKDQQTGAIGFKGGPADFKLILEYAPAGDAPAAEEPAAAEEAAAESAVPADLVGTWHGTGKPKNGSSPIDLTVTVNADGTGDYTFAQGDYTESYPFTLEHDSNKFTVSVPTGNTLGIATVDGTWELDGDVLKLDISTELAGGRIFSYTAECTKTE